MRGQAAPTRRPSGTARGAGLDAVGERPSALSSTPIDRCRADPLAFLGNPQIPQSVQDRSSTRRRALGGILLASISTVAGYWLLKQRRAAQASGSDRRAVRVGYAVETPYAFVDKAGRVSGADPETARLVASRLGWTIEWVQTGFADLIPELLEGRFDLIAAGLFITPQRERLVRFAAPHLRARPGLLVPAGNPKALGGYADLRSPRVRIAVLAGSVEEKRLAARSSAPLLSLPDARAGAAAVQTGLVDALALSLPTVRSMAREHPGLEAVRATDGVPAPVAAAFRPAERDLISAWSKAQAGVVGGEAHLRAIAPFGFEADDVPESPATGGHR